LNFYLSIYIHILFFQPSNFPLLELDGLIFPDEYADDQDTEMPFSPTPSDDSSINSEGSMPRSPRSPRSPGRQRSTRSPGTTRPRGKGNIVKAPNIIHWTAEQVIVDFYC
jgi:hypothetical protein